MTRCYCVSDTEMGWVAIYNLTSPSFRGMYFNSSSTVWYRNGTVPRDDFDRPHMCGKECNADRSDCWDVPRKSRSLSYQLARDSPLTPFFCAEVTQYSSLIRRSWPDYTKACVQVDGRRMCADQSSLQVDGQVQYIHRYNAAQSYETKLDCSAECLAQWPEKEMKSACTHLNTNKKSKHYDQAVPCGHFWKGNKLRQYMSGPDQECAVDVRSF